MATRKALERIGKTLYQQRERWQPKSRSLADIFGTLFRIVLLDEMIMGSANYHQFHIQCYRLHISIICGCTGYGSEICLSQLQTLVDDRNVEFQVDELCDMIPRKSGAFL